MLTLNIDNPTVENYFHQSADEIYNVLEAIAMRKARLVIGDNVIPQAAVDIMQDIEAYRRGELKTTPFEEGMDEMMQNLKNRYANQ